MQTDLFGQEVSGPLEQVRFSDDEAELILEDVVYSGMLIEQMGRNLKRLRGIEGKTTMDLARRDAWTDLMWAFDLWDHPAQLPFETVCDLVGADSETIRSAISTEFGNELRLLIGMIVARYPEEKERLHRTMKRYIVIGEFVH